MIVLVGPGGLWAARMNFPETHSILIQRLAGGGDDQDWQTFLTDYWAPVCRFARRCGASSAADAEDVASQTFLALLTNQLLERWASQRSAKLRTLLSAVVRNVVANRARVASGRARLLRAGGAGLARAALEEPEDAFYASWADDLVHQAVEWLLAQYNEEGKGDYFRVLYGRLCEGTTMPAIAEALGLQLSQAENAYKHARRRLARRLEELVRAHVRRYCPAGEAEAELAAEWGRLGHYLKGHGGLEEALRRAYEQGPR
jgi:RNA polymerase sigma factor (sigma-70 family)